MKQRWICSLSMKSTKSASNALRLLKPSDSGLGNDTLVSCASAKLNSAVTCDARSKPDESFAGLAAISKLAVARAAIL